MNVERLEEKLNLNGSTYHVWQLLKLLGNSIVMCHMVGTAYFFLAICEIDYLDISDTWIHKNGLIDSHQVVQYIESFYWALATITLIGTKGDTPLETFYCIVVLVFTVGIFATILSQVSIVWEAMQQNIKDYKKQKDILSTFFQANNNINTNLQYQLHNYLKYHYEGHKEKTTNDEFSQLMQTFPESLQGQVRRERYTEEIKNFTLLTNNFSQKIIDSLLDIVKEEYYMPNQIIMKKKSIKDPCLYLIMTGEVQIYQEIHRNSNIKTGENSSEIDQILKKGLIRQPSVMQVLQKGEYFGQNIFFTDQQTYLSARSTEKSFLTVLTISKSDFQKIINQVGNENDKEMFAMIKDEIYFKGYSPRVDTPCYICSSDRHAEPQCNILSLQVNRDILIRRLNYQTPQERSTGSRRSFRINAIILCANECEIWHTYQLRLLEKPELRQYLKVIQEHQKLLQDLQDEQKTLSIDSNSTESDYYSVTSSEHLYQDSSQNGDENGNNDNNNDDDDKNDDEDDDDDDDEDDNNQFPLNGISMEHVQSQEKSAKEENSIEMLQKQPFSNEQKKKVRIEFKSEDNLKDQFLIDNSSSHNYRFSLDKDSISQNNPGQNQISEEFYNVQENQNEQDQVIQTLHLIDQKPKIMIQQLNNSPRSSRNGSPSNSIKQTHTQTSYLTKDRGSESLAYNFQSDYNEQNKGGSKREISTKRKSKKRELGFNKKPADQVMYQRNSITQPISFNQREIRKSSFVKKYTEQGNSNFQFRSTENNKFQYSNNDHQVYQQQQANIFSNLKKSSKQIQRFHKNLEPQFQMQQLKLYQNGTRQKKRKGTIAMDSPYKKRRESIQTSILIKNKQKKTNRKAESLQDSVGLTQIPSFKDKSNQYKFPKGLIDSRNERNTAIDQSQFQQQSKQGRKRKQSHDIGTFNYGQVYLQEPEQFFRSARKVSKLVPGTQLDCQNKVIMNGIHDVALQNYDIYQQILNTQIILYQQLQSHQQQHTQLHQQHLLSQAAQQQKERNGSLSQQIISQKFIEPKDSQYQSQDQNRSQEFYVIQDFDWKETFKIYNAHNNYNLVIEQANYFTVRQKKRKEKEKQREFEKQSRIKNKKRVGDKISFQTKIETSTLK